MTPAIQLDNVFAGYGSAWPRSSSNRLTLHGIDLTIPSGSIYGLVGESGSGKSTLARVLLRLMKPLSGRVAVAGHDPYRPRRHELMPFRRLIQPVFQDSMAALDPRIRIGDSLRMVLDLHGIGRVRDRHRAVGELLQGVGLDPALQDRFPHQISGGQRQRVTIARALSITPQILIADEPISALDLTVQAHILDLLSRLCRERGVTMLFISHDLATVRRIADHVAVMKDGRIVDDGTVDAVFERPADDYTRLLLDSIPRVDFAKLSAALAE